MTLISREEADAREYVAVHGGLTRSQQGRAAKKVKLVRQQVSAVLKALGSKPGAARRAAQRARALLAELALALRPEKKAKARG